MRPLIRSTMAGAVLLPAMFVLAGSAATAATASAHVPTVIVAAVSHAAQAAPASPDPAMPGMDMSGSGGADTMPGMDMEPKTRSTDPAPGHRAGGASGQSRKALVLGGFAAVNAGVLLVAAILRRSTPRRRATTPRRRDPARVPTSSRTGTAGLAPAYTEGASS